MDPTLRERLDALPPEQRAELLARLPAWAAREDTVRRLPPGATPALSHAQRRLWFLDRLMEHQPVYHTPVILRLRGPLDVAALGKALTALVARHAVLRTRFSRNQQVIDPAPAAVPFPLADLSGADQAERERLAHEYVGRASREPFDLATAPPLRARLLRLAGDDHIFALVLHHIVMDDWSVPLLIAELGQGYLAALSGAGPALPELPVQYADYAMWQRRRLDGRVGDQQAAYWARRLAGMSPTRLPADRPRPRRPAWAGETITMKLPPELVAGLAEAHRGPLLTVLATGLSALLSRWTGSTDIAIGTVFSGRVRPEIEPLIGFFSNTLVLRVDTSDDPALRTLLERTTESVTGAHSNQELPFDQVVAQQRPRRSGAHNPLFGVMLVTSDAPLEGFTVGELEVEPVEVQLGTSRFDLTLGAVRPAGGGLALNAEYSTELFDRTRITCLLNDLRAVLEELVSAPETRLGSLRLAGPVPGVSLAEPEEAPRGPSEAPAAVSRSRTGRIVAELWSTALGVAGGRPGDDFFALGGGSIQAVSLIMALRDHLGAELNLGDFFGNPTLAALTGQVEAALLEGPHDDPEEPGAGHSGLVVPLRAGDDAEPPVFFFHASGGSSMSYTALCRALPPGIPCLGIESLGLDRGDLPGSVGEMADAYAVAIRSAFPEGPYRLAGWSVGGGLAYATAVRLREQGGLVTLLAMLDTQEPPILRERPDTAVLRAFFAENIALTAGLPPAGPGSAELAGLDDAAQAEKVLHTLVAAGLVLPESVQLLRRRMEVFAAIVSAAAVWRPDHYGGRVDLFLAPASPKSTAAAWSTWTSGPVVAHDAPGDHYAMMRSPHVAELGRALGALLERSAHAAG